jgi:hypothetical protein
MAIKLDNTLNVESRLPIEPLIDKQTKAEIHDGIPFVKLVRVEVVKTVHEKGEYKGLYIQRNLWKAVKLNILTLTVKQLMT